jgi:hypothetical protein
LDANFFIPGLVIDQRQDVKLIFRFIDHLGRRHRARLVALSPAQRAVPGEPIPKPRELLGAIQDALERDIAAILQDEVERYRRAGGRQQGKLGTVATVTPNGAPRPGLPNDGPPAATPAAQIQSENAQALVDIYHSLEDHRRLDFDVFLLGRTNRDSDYRSVAYVVLLTMRSLGRLPVFLTHAQQQLRGCEGFGFEDTLRTLASTLQTDWTSFTDDDLTAAERFAADLDGHTYYIREKVAAIRAMRARRSGADGTPKVDA